VRVADSQQDRVLLLIGAGHIKMLRDYVKQSPNLKLVETVDYLP
jgi:pheromone shutdown protein TraB